MNPEDLINIQITKEEIDHVISGLGKLLRIHIDSFNPFEMSDLEYYNYKNTRNLFIAFKVEMIK